MSDVSWRLLVFGFLLVGRPAGVHAAGAAAVAWDFSVGDSPVYHLRSARTEEHGRSVVVAALDGTTACFRADGTPLWRSAATGGFPFDLAVADVDGDGRDEVFVASGDGGLYAYDDDGRSLWTFRRAPPLYQVCVARGPGGRATLLTGGVEQVLYALTPAGEVRARLETEHCIRHLRAGDVTGEGRDALVMVTASSGLTGILKLMLIDPADLSERWRHNDLRVPGMNPGRRFFSLLLEDLDKDGAAEILLGGGWRENGMVHAYDGKGNLRFSKSDRRIPNIPYRMSLLRKIVVPGDEYLIGHFGNLLILYEMDGSLREVVAGPYAFADSHFDRETRTLFMGSDVSGGTEVYAYRLDAPDWTARFRAQRAAGRLREIEENVATLERQVRAFRPPPYQPAPKPALAITHLEDTGEFRHVQFARSLTLSQRVDDPGELWCRDRDRRMPYRDSAEELVAVIAGRESRRENTLVWAGHGNAIYFPLATFEKLMVAGPRHLKGFVFAEMEGVNEHTQEVVSKIILPLAELCRKHGKIIVFRNKNIFWNGTCYLPFWSEVLLNDRFRDVFVPGLEETNSRTQELSLLGRVGLWQAGCFARWACRTVTDDANFNRMFEWGAQQRITHHLRNLASTAALGADLFLSDIHAGHRGTPVRIIDGEEAKAAPGTPGARTREDSGLYEQLRVFYEMLEKGILRIPAPADLLSCSDFALVVRTPPSPLYLKHGINGHGFTYPKDGDPEMVFSRLDTYWGGSVVPAHDFSAYALNVRQRTWNFLPEFPFGLVPLLPASTASGGRFRRTITTDGERFFDETGQPRSAAEYRPEVERALREAADRLPVRVSGPAHSAVVRLDDRHLRVTLIDPGYLDPAERRVELRFQGIRPVACVDLLGGQALAPVGDALAVTIPAGTLRIIDVTLDRPLGRL